MSDELLPYYNRELAYFRRLARGFAEANPKIAGRLRLGAEGSQDPYVERMIEAFAFLNARTRHKIEDEFPEISEALLTSLHPHYLLPIPSMAIVQFHPDDSLAAPYEIPRHTEIATEPVDGEPCYFRTIYPLCLWPLRLSAARLAQLPVAAPATPRSGAANAVLQWTFQGINEVLISEQPPDRLRLCLEGPTQHTFHLYELLLNNTLEIAVAGGPGDREPIVLPPSAIQPVGFSPDEGMLPYPARSALAYRLLSEFFTFPRKFLFVDLSLPSADLLSRFATEMQVYVYLNRTSVDLEQNVSEETFRLGCTPILNLFRRRTEPVTTDGRAVEYRIEPDARRPEAIEVFSLDHVVATYTDGAERELAPLYSIRHGEERDQDAGYWHAVSRPSVTAAGLGPGTDTYISLAHRSAEPVEEDGIYLDIESTCFNRDLPSRLPFGAGQPALSVAGGGPFEKVECLTPPTPTQRPPRRDAVLWRLISHLSLGHLPLTGGPDGAAALREILSLYDIREDSESEAVFASLLSVESRRSVARVSGGVCRGVEVRIECSANQFSENGLYLFASVLDHFLGQHCSLNSFTQMTVAIEGWESPLAQWPPRAGNRVLT